MGSFHLGRYQGNSQGKLHLDWDKRKHVSRLMGRGNCSILPVFFELKEMSYLRWRGCDGYTVR